MRDQLLRIRTVCGHTFMPGPLSPASVVVDLGAHKGEFAAEIVRRYRCRCIAIEAQPLLAQNLSKIRGVEAVACAVTSAEGEVDLKLSSNSEAATVRVDRSREPAGEVVRVPARRLWSVLGERGVERVDLLKVDIEGAEVEVMGSMSAEELARIDQIAVEFHDFCGLVEAREIEGVCSRLQRTGFAAVRFAPWNLNWLFVRAAAVGSLRLAYVRGLIRPLRAAARAVRGI